MLKVGEYGLRKDFVFPNCVYDITGLSGGNISLRLCVPQDEAGAALECLLEAYRRTAVNSGTVHVDNSGEVIPVMLRPRRDEKRESC